jgi:hypothetical protein
VGWEVLEACVCVFWEPGVDVGCAFVFLVLAAAVGTGESSENEGSTSLKLAHRCPELLSRPELWLLVLSRPLGVLAVFCQGDAEGRLRGDWDWDWDWERERESWLGFGVWDLWDFVILVFGVVMERLGVENGGNADPRFRSVCVCVAFAGKGGCQFSRA